MATTATVAVTTVATPAAAASAAGSEEETAKKKNTDCVYFLASPLTCKKGEDCEFRHSESARLNPRDCWYWVGGNCLNRDCPFRHPPLEARPSAPPAPVHPKKPVPCYFFSQGCCTKGSKCQYLHGGPSTVNFQHQKEFGDKQHDNVGPSPMVYRLSDSSKSGPASDNSKPKLAKPADDSSMPDADHKRETTQQSTVNREQGPRKDNVYRLQDDPKRGKSGLATAVTVTSRETPEAGSDHSNEQPGLKHRADTDLRNRIGKQQKESYTWKLSENPSQKQPAESHQRRQEKHGKGASHQEQGEAASRASRSVQASVDRKRASHRNNESGTSMSRSSDKMTQGLDGIEAKEMADFVGPKSLAQIKKEKRKHSDTDEPAAATSKVRRKSFSEGDDRSEHLRRRLSNGSAGTSSSDIESIEDGGAAVESKPDAAAPNGGVENAEAAAPAMFISEAPETAADNGGPKDQVEPVIKANNNNNTESDVVEMQGGSEDDEDDFAQKLGGLFS